MIGSRERCAGGKVNEMTTIEIDSKWVLKHGPEYTKQFYEKYSGENKRDPGVFVFNLPDEEIECTGVEKDMGVFLRHDHDGINIGMCWKPKVAEVVDIVDVESDNLDSDGIPKLVEIVVKKLNRFKAAIEAIKAM